MQSTAALLSVLSLTVYAEEAALDTLPLDTVIVNAPRIRESSLGASSTDKSGLASRRPATSDTANLLQDVPGVSLYGAGGVSSLPVIHGMADDRIRIQVDGMDLVAACPNHMNSALSYIDPTRVASATVFAAITPVSAGGDSIAGTIQVKSAPPEFASAGEKIHTEGKASGFYRSNGNGYGGSVTASIASETLNLSYSGASAQSNNYTAARDFKKAGAGTVGGAWLDGNVVGSTNYNSKNQDIGFAYQRENHLLQFNMGSQDIGFEGFPNQRMDMTANNSTQINLHYSGWYDWGNLEARLYNQDTRHAMNMGADRFTYGTLGMPMLTEAKTMGALLQGNIEISSGGILRVGSEFQAYTLYDWWPQAGGMMGPNTFWNVDFGTRDRYAAFAEWEANWNPAWLAQLDIRSDVVQANAGAVQGYNATSIWAVDAAAFNALDRQRTDVNWDMAALARHTPDARLTFDFGYARKSHSPNLYQRYPWSTQPMAALMNNFVGDGNGYLGNVDLKPEIAHTLSASGDWHDADKERWSFKATGYYTHVQNYIDAKRCDSGQCGGAANLIATSGFVNLQYLNQNTQLYGVDLSGKTQLLSTARYGDFSGSGVFNYVRGKNLTTGDNLYNLMPPNAKLALEHRSGAWTNTAEMQLVDAKTQVSQVRNEVQTGAYNLFNLRSSYERKTVRLDASVENVFNRFYALPLGGAYLGQGASMTSNGIPWGVIVPGRGRSISIGLNMGF